MDLDFSFLSGQSNVGLSVSSVVETVDVPLSETLISSDITRALTSPRGAGMNKDGFPVPLPAACNR